MAIISSGSVGGWAIWNSLSVMWMVIVMISQVISIAKDYLPYSMRVKELSDLKCELSFIYTEIEEKWLSVSDGSLTEKEINMLFYHFTKKWNEVDSKYFTNDYLPSSVKLTSKAQNITNEYLKQTFIGG